MNGDDHENLRLSSMNRLIGRVQKIAVENQQADYCQLHTGNAGRVGWWFWVIELSGRTPVEITLVSYLCV